jgi:hypothetical protein
MANTVAKEEVDYTIKPEASSSNINTADWPLLLKNYDKRMSMEFSSFISSCPFYGAFSRCRVAD